MLNRLDAKFSDKKFSMFPMIFWLSEFVNDFLIRLNVDFQDYDAEDNMFHLVCLTGIILSALILIERRGRIFTNFITMSFLWYLNYSVFVAG